MGKKVIRISLSEKDIGRAIRELEMYKREILRKTELLRTRVAERIGSLAQSGFNGASVDDLTNESCGAKKMCIRDRSTIEESPMGYKPMAEIVANIAETVDILMVIKPLYNYKASE